MSIVSATSAETRYRYNYCNSLVAIFCKRLTWIDGLDRIPYNISFLRLDIIVRHEKKEVLTIYLINKTSVQLLLLWYQVWDF